MILTHGDRQSQVWLKLKDELLRQLDSLRNQNDSNLDVEATAKLRGRIAQVKAILDMGNDPPPMQEKSIPI